MAMGMCLHLLWRLPGENDIDTFLNSLPPAEVQTLWKKFDYNRNACLNQQERPTSFSFLMAQGADRGSGTF